MLQDSLQRPTRSGNVEAIINTTTKSLDTDEGFEVPLAAYILLGILGVCLVAMAFIYLGLRHYQRKLMDRIVSHGRDWSEECETGLLPLKKISDEEEHVDAIPDKIKQQYNVYHFPPLRTAVLVISVAYSPSVGRLAVEIIRLETVAKEILKSGVAPYVKIHARLQPLSNQFRYRSSSKPISKAVFNERFAFDGFRKRDLEKCWFRFRVYSHKLVGRDRILGQVNASVMEFEVDSIWSTLKLNVAPSEEVHKLLVKKD